MSCRIRGVERERARSRAGPSLLRGSCDIAVCRGDCLGRVDSPSSRYRRRHGPDPGSGGVSVFALQFAQVLGARVIATTSTAEKAERLKALGAAEVVNYAETPNWDEKARELTDGRGVDSVVEIGGPGTMAMSLKALAVGGHISLIGASLSSSGTGLDPLLLTGHGITLGSISVGSRTDFEAMNRAIEMHRLRPVIDRTFPFAEAKEAYRHFLDRGHFGKVVISRG
jgi:NADPH:quinone reductase-like Zn-dependent oxidoreductase